jgi:hypothetical protein
MNRNCISEEFYGVTLFYVILLIVEPGFECSKSSNPVAHCNWRDM